MAGLLLLGHTANNASPTATTDAAGVRDTAAYTESEHGPESVKHDYDNALSDNRPPLITIFQKPYVVVESFAFLFN